MADDELSQVRLREASQLLQRVVLGHRQARDVRRQLREGDAEGVGRRVALLQAQHHAQDVRHTLRHLCTEGGREGGRRGFVRSQCEVRGSAGVSSAQPT